LSAGKVEELVSESSSLRNVEVFNPVIESERRLSQPINHR